MEHRIAAGDLAKQTPSAKISTSQAFKGLQVVRFYGRKLNCLVYLTRSTRWVNCSYKNAASAVSIMPWGE